MSLRDKVQEMIGEDEELDPKEVSSFCLIAQTPQISNLILDDLEIPKLTPEDKAFLEEFINLEKMAMNKTQLTSTENFPDAPGLARVSAYLPSGAILNSSFAILRAKRERIGCSPTKKYY